MRKNLINWDNNLTNLIIKNIPSRITKKIEIGFFIFVFLTFIFLFYKMSSGLWFPNTDNIQNFVFSKNFAEHNTLVYQDELNQRFKPAIFGVRGMVIRDDGSAVPTSMPGYILILGLVRKIADNLVYFVNPLFAVLALLYLYKISQLIFPDKRLSFLVIILASISAPFLFVANIPFNNIAATAFFLAGLYHLLKIIFYLPKPLNLLDLSLAGIFTGLVFWVRYETIIFYLPPLIVLLIQLCRRFNRSNLISNFLKLSLPIAIFAIFLILFFIFNQKLYGAPLGFLSPEGQVLGWYQAKIENIVNIPIYQRLFALPELGYFLQNLKNQIFLVSPILSILLVISIYFLFKEKQNKAVLISLVLVILFQFWFYFSKKWSGDIFEGSIGTSYARYLLISWLIISLLGVYSLIKISQIISLKNFALLFFLIYLAMNLNTFLFSEMGYQYFIVVKRSNIENHQQLISRTSENSIIFCRLLDRYIYPIRKTAIYSTIPESERALTTVKLMKELLKSGHEVYIIDEYQHAHKDNYKKDFEEILLKLKKTKLKVQSQDFFPYLYQITI